MFVHSRKQSDHFQDSWKIWFVISGFLQMQIEQQPV